MMEHELRMQVTVACVQQEGESREEERKRQEEPGVIPTGMQDGKACFKQPRECVGLIHPQHHEASSQGGAEGRRRQRAQTRISWDIPGAICKIEGGT